MSHLTEGTWVGTALGKFCKLGSSKRLDIAFPTLEKLIAMARIVRTNEDRKLLLFYLIFRVGGRVTACFICMLSQLRVGDCVRVEDFPPIFKIGMLKNGTVELSKFSLKMAVC